MTPTHRLEGKCPRCRAAEEQQVDRTQGSTMRHRFSEHDLDVGHDIRERASIVRTATPPMQDERWLNDGSVCCSADTTASVLNFLPTCGAVLTSV